MKKYCVCLEFFLSLCLEQSQGAQIFLQHKPFLSIIAFIRQRNFLVALLGLTGLIVCPMLLAAQVSGIYRVDTKKSQVEIHLFKGGFLSALGDNHLIALTRFSGMADLSRTIPWKADLSGYAASLKVVDPWGSLSERKEVEETMLGPEQLDVSRYPMILLHSLTFDPTDQDTTWHLVADVELHGVTRKENFSLFCRQIGDRLRIRGKKMLRLTDFNIQPFSRAFGAVKVRNQFEVTYDITLERKP